MVFFDGEEAFVDWSDTDSLYGSRHLAAKWEQEVMVCMCVCTCACACACVYALCLCVYVMRARACGACKSTCAGACV